MSVVTRRAIPKKPKDDRRTREARKAASSSVHLRQKKKRHMTHRKAARALGNLKDHSLTPKSLYDMPAQ
jgi:hypothetical protein